MSCLTIQKHKQQKSIPTKAKIRYYHRVIKSAEVLYVVWIKILPINIKKTAKFLKCKKRNCKNNTETCYSSHVIHSIHECYSTNKLRQRLNLLTRRRKTWKCDQEKKNQIFSTTLRNECCRLTKKIRNFLYKKIIKMFEL